MNEIHKYITKFDFVTFLGFSDQYSLRFKKITKLITSFIKIDCILFLLIIFVRAFLVIELLIDEKSDDTSFELFK